MRKHGNLSRVSDHQQIQRGWRVLIVARWAAAGPDASSAAQDSPERGRAPETGGKQDCGTDMQS